MGVLEIISGVLLILCSIAIIVMVLFQESKGNGLSGGRHQHLSEISQKKARQLLAGFFAIYLRRPGKSIVMCVE